MPSEGLVERISQNLGNSRRLLISRLVPMALFNSIEDCIDLETPPDTPEQELWQAIKRFVIAHAYATTIPHIDLVLTATGFGVVSNANLAPASTDRVERLLLTVRHQAMSFFEEVLSLLRNFDQWRNSPQALSYRSLFWHSRFLAKFGVPSPDLDLLKQYRPKILLGVARLSELISPVFLNHLIREELSATTDDLTLMAIDLCRNLVAAIDDAPSAALHWRVLSRFLDDNIEAFPLYRDSSAYKANHPDLYRNEQDDSCYFFG